jgi:xanthine dehydrogenase accessory factor
MDSVDLNVLRSVLEWRRAGQRVVLFSVVRPGAPRPVRLVRCWRCAKTVW